MINVPYEDMPREIEALLGEIEQLEQENQNLKEEVIALRKGLSKTRIRRDKYKRRYLKEKWKNQQLKQKYEMQKDSNKLLCKAITCDDCDCKVCEAHIENIKYKSVLDEIREQLKLERKLALSLNKPYTLSVIDKLLDKVKQ